MNIRLLFAAFSLMFVSVNRKRLFKCNSRRTFLILRFLVCSSAGASVAASFCAYGERLARFPRLYTASLSRVPSTVYIVKKYVI